MLGHVTVIDGILKKQLRTKVTGNGGSVSIDMGPGIGMCMVRLPAGAIATTKHLINNIAMCKAYSSVTCPFCGQGRVCQTMVGVAKLRRYLKRFHVCRRGYTRRAQQSYTVRLSLRAAGLNV